MSKKRIPIAKSAYIWGAGNAVEVRDDEGWIPGMLSGRVSFEAGGVSHLWVYTLKSTDADQGYALENIRVKEGTDAPQEEEEKG